MARTQQKKSLWTPEEDDKLKEFRHKYPNLSWPAIAKQAELNRTGKSCWESWENNLNPDINKGEFSPQEDELIIPLKSAGVSWASMAKNDLRGRAPNAIKNRWNNHLKKRHAIISDLRRHLLYLEEHLMDDKASDYSVRGGDLKALMAKFASLIPNVDPNESSDHSIREDDLEALMAKFASLIPNVDANETSDHSIRGDDLEALMAKFASLIPNVDPNESSDHSIREDDLEALMAKFASLIPNVDPNETSDHSIRGDDLEALMAKFASLIPNVDPSAISSIPEYTS